MPPFLRRLHIQPKTFWPLKFEILYGIDMEKQIIMLMCKKPMFKATRNCSPNLLRSVPKGRLLDQEGFLIFTVTGSPFTVSPASFINISMCLITILETLNDLLWEMDGQEIEPIANWVIYL